MRRQGSPLYGAKYCGNVHKMEVHDLDNEQTVCQIDEIINAGHAVAIHSLPDAHQRGFDNCAFCIGNSQR